VGNDRNMAKRKLGRTEYKRALPARPEGSGLLEAIKKKSLKSYFLKGRGGKTLGLFLGRGKRGGEREEPLQTTGHKCGVANREETSHGLKKKQ